MKHRQINNQESSFARFDRYVDRNGAAFVERLQELCRMPSIAVRGTGMRAAADAIEQSLQRIGAGTRQIKIGSGHPIVYGECGDETRSLIVYGNYDVAPIGHLPDWSYGPFAATVVDDKLYGRGVSTSKGDLAARFAAVEAYQKTFGKLPICIKFLIEGEDGLGSASLLKFAADEPELFRAEGCIWDEGYRDAKDHLVISTGIKGLLCLDLYLHGPRTNLHSRWAAIVPNPAWRLVQALSTIASPRGVITIDGLSSHIAPPSSADAELLKHIALEDAELKREFRISSWLRGMKGAALVKEHIFGATCNIYGLDSGHKDAGVNTVIPAHARARMDFRLVPDLTPGLVIKLLREHLDVRGFSEIEVRPVLSMPYAKSDADSALAKAAIETAEEVYGAPPIVYPMDPTSGPIGAVCAANLPATPVVSFGVSYAASNPHGPDENIRLADFHQGIKHFGRLIHRLGQG